MNVLLVNPYWPYPYSYGESTYNRIWPPLCLANSAAILERAGHKVNILDAHAMRIRPDKIINFINGCDKIFITSSSLDKWQCPNIDINNFLETVRTIRKAKEEVYALGYHGTIKPEDILISTGARAVIRGEPEYTILEICQNYDLTAIKGVSFFKKGRFLSNPDREAVNLETLPIPAYHLLKMEKYFYEILGRNFMLFEISRGCKYQCRHCNKAMHGEGLRNKSVRQICEEVEAALKYHKVKSAYFIDLDFLSNRNIVEGLCDFLIKNKYRLKWCCQTRPDSLDAEILKKMKKAGCELIHLGVESNLKESQDYLNKRVGIDKLVDSVKSCRMAKIKTLIFLLFGFPGERSQDRLEILRFVKNVVPDYVSFHKIIPYEGSKIFQNDTKCSNGADVDKFIRKAYINYYLSVRQLFNLNMSYIIEGLTLFWGRLKTLK